jgi:hypothetical protein
MALLALPAGFTACSDDTPGDELTAPEPSTSGTRDATRTSIVVAGRYGGKLEKITEYGVKYSTSSNFPSDATTTVSFEGSPSSVVSTTLSDLSPNTHYYYCWYASTGASTVQSAAGEFTTNATSKPMFSELQCDSLSETVLVLRCQLLEYGDTYLIEQGVSYRVKSNSQNNSYTPVSTDSIDTETNEFVVVLSGLTAATTYEVRPYAKNSSDAEGESGMLEGYGDTQEFTTENQLAPEVEMFDPSGVKSTSATVSGRITSANGSNGVVDEFGICYSTTKEEPTWQDNAIKFEGKTLNQIYAYEMTGLIENTTYYVRFYAKNTVNGKARYGYSDTMHFTTATLKSPSLSIEAGVATPYTITCSAEIYENYDENALVEKGFIWSASSADVTLEEAKSNNCQMEVINTGKNFEGTISGLKMSNSYYIRAYAIYKSDYNEVIGYSTAVYAFTSSFKTATLDSPVVTDVTYTTGTLNGKIASTGNGEIIEKGFCLSRNTSNPRVDNSDLVLKADNDFTAKATGLELETTYWVRAYAICQLEDNQETVYSSYTEFRTSDYERPEFNNTEINSTYTSISASTKLTYTGTGTIVEKGVLLNDETNNWSLSYDNYTQKIVSTDTSDDVISGTFDGLKLGTSYYIGFYTISEIDGKQFVSYDGTYGRGTNGIDTGLWTEARDSSYIDVVIYKWNEDFTAFTEVGIYWSEGSSISVKDMTNKKAATVSPDDFRRYTVRMEGLKAETTYSVGYYYKLNNGTEYTGGTWDFSTTITKTVPSIDDKNSPDKKD